MVINVMHYQLGAVIIIFSGKQIPLNDTISFL
jgi:hypothetical protein